MKLRVSFALVVIAVTAAIGFYNMQMKPAWTSDGYIYAIRSQVDAGISYAIARTYSREFYSAKPAMQWPQARATLHAATPKWWNLFAVRPLYPALASLLWPLAGFQSLLYVSFAAYITAGVLLYAIFLRFASPAIAAAVAIFCILNPEAQLIGRSNLTDMLAFALLAGTLLAAMRYATDGHFADLLAFALTAALLSFTRPIPYELVCSVAPLLVAGAWRRGIDLIAISLGLTIALAAVMRITGAAIPPVPNYIDASLATTWVTIVALFAHAAAPVPLIALLAMRRRADVLICGGALASIVFTILVAPYPTDVMRTIILPSLIPLGCGFAIAAEAALSAGRAYHSGTAIVREWSGSESILAAPRPKSSPLT